MTRFLRSVLGTMAILAIVATTSPTLGYAQTDENPIDAPTLELGWRQLGMMSTAHFGAANSLQTLTIPVPAGLSPTQVSGVMHSATNIVSGYLEATDIDGAFLGSVPIPEAAAGQTAVPFTIDLAQARPRDGELVVNWYLRITAGDPFCGPLPTLVVSKFSVTFSGDLPQPTTLQQFFPAIAPGIDIYLDPNPTAAESFTALNLVTALVHHYRPASVDISLHPLTRNQPPPPGTEGFRRAIVIRDSDEPGIALIANGSASYLAVTGEADRLEQQASLFRYNLLSIAQTQSAQVESIQTLPTEGVRTVTFGQINAASTVAVLGEATLPLALDDAPFPLSRPGQIDVNLRAHYTPVQEAEKGTLMVSSAGTALHSAELDSSGHLDTRFVIPAELAARNDGLLLTVNYQPARGACEPRTLPMTFKVDPASTATRNPGDVVEMGGFSSLPQGFSPSFQVAADDSGLNTLTRAAQILALVQEQSRVELLPTLVSLDEAANSSRGALILAHADSLAAYNLDPPIDATGTLNSIDVPVRVDVTIPENLASIQAFAHNNRTVVLVTTSGSWSLTGPLFTYLADLEDGWRDLHGDVLAAGQGAIPQLLTVRASGPTMVAPKPGDQWKPWAWLSAICVAAAAGLVIVYLLRRRSAKAVTADE